ESISLAGAFVAGTYFVFKNALPGKQSAVLSLRIAGISLAVWVVVLGASAMSAPQEIWEAGKGVALPCVMVVSRVNAVVLLPFFWILRRNRVVSNRVIIPGVFCVAVLGGVAIQWICPSENPIHILLWHGLPMTAAGILIALLSKKLVKSV
ncbi:DUF1109 family protein, partial [bacterium]|nr:DUF1109 family protein [bacterium]